MRWGAMGGLLALAGCGGDVEIARLRGELSVSPVVDFDLAVGDPSAQTLLLGHTGAAVEIQGVQLNPPNGPFSVVAEFPLLIAADSNTFSLPIEVATDIEGVFEADLSILSDATEAYLPVRLRARVSKGLVSARPERIDFGPVSTTGTAEVIVRNLGRPTVALDRAELEPPTAPFTWSNFISSDGDDRVDPAEEGTLAVTVTNPGAPEFATLTLYFSGQTPPVEVRLAANDCDGGNPTIYDLDGDGFLCGFDCDETDARRNRGAAEIADEVDNDCDGAVDEGTAGFDDDSDGFTEEGGDCNDASGLMAPEHAEAADGIDNDCDGTVDEGTVDFDDDGDGFTERGGDCDDASAEIHPGVFYDPPGGVDEDCDPET